MQYSPSTMHKSDKEAWKVKKYENPEFDIISLTLCDVITASPGTETTPKPDDDGIWDLNI